VLTRLFFSLQLVKNNVDQTFTLIVQVVIMAGVPILSLFVLNRKNNKAPKANIKSVFGALGFKKISNKLIALSFLIGFFVFFANLGVSTFFNALLRLFGYTPSPVPPDKTGGSVFIALLSGIFFTGVLPAVCEEIAHRGLLLNGYKPLGGLKAVIYSAVAFGLMHSFIQQTFYAFIIGVALGLLAISCESIFPAIIVHFMNNSMSVLWQVTSYEGGIGYYFTKFLNSSGEYVFGAFFIMLIWATSMTAVLFLTLYFMNLGPYKIENTSPPDKTLRGNFGEALSSEKEVWFNKIFAAAAYSLIAFTTLATFIWGIVR
jgi:membrane protease YdiL (CAAX protease family)